MLKLIQLHKADFNAVILRTAEKLGIHAAIVEKDLWVCVTLDYLFTQSKWKDQLAFKGGTCLSKAYHLINRFSEDIDLILDWRVLGYQINEPWEERSNTKQLQFIDGSRKRLFEFLKLDFLPAFIKDMSSLMKAPCNAYIDANDPGTVIFAYPYRFSNQSILNTIRLEIGILASWMPIRNVSIQPMISNVFPNIMNQKDVPLLAVTPERTFWEKATILHQEANRPEGSRVPKRYSRHYYDLYCMCKSGVKDCALLLPDLLIDVARFKMKFYPRGWARYDLAKFGSLMLMPPSHSMEPLKQDYEDMKSMIYGEYPFFDEILLVLAALQQEINK